MNKPKLLLGLSVLLVLLARSSAFAQGCAPSVILGVTPTAGGCGTANVIAVTKGDSPYDLVDLNDNSTLVQALPFNTYLSGTYPCNSLQWGGFPTTVSLVDGVNEFYAYSEEMDESSNPVRINEGSNGHGWIYSYAASGTCYLQMNITVQCVSPSGPPDGNNRFKAYETPGSGDFQGSVINGGTCTRSVTMADESATPGVILSSSSGTVEWPDNLEMPNCNDTCNLIISKVWHLKDRVSGNEVSSHGDTVSFTHSDSSHWSVSDSEISQTSHN